MDIKLQLDPISRGLRQTLQTEAPSPFYRLQLDPISRGLRHLEHQKFFVYYSITIRPDFKGIETSQQSNKAQSLHLITIRPDFKGIETITIYSFPLINCFILQLDPISRGLRR